MDQNNNDLVSIRCPGDRPHSGKYDICNHLIGALDGKDLILFCDNCKQFYKLKICEHGHVVLKPLDKSQRLKFKNKLRVIDND